MTMLTEAQTTSNDHECPTYTTPRAFAPCHASGLAAPSEQIGIGLVELHDLAEREIAARGQGGEDGPGGRVGQSAVIDLLLGRVLQQAKTLEGAEASLDA